MTESPKTETLLAVQDLCVEFGARAQPYRAVKSLDFIIGRGETCLLYTSPSPLDRTRTRMPSSA